MAFAARLKGVDESATFRYLRLAKEVGAIDLAAGRTNFDSPPQLKDALKRAIDEGKVHYTETKGIRELRNLIAEKYSELLSIELDEENVLVSAGGKHLIFEALMVLASRRTEVAFPDPCWVSYEPMVRLCEALPLRILLSCEDGFVPSEAFFSAVEEHRPRVVIVNSPNNPTGVVYPETVVRRIAEVAESVDAWLISDEVYAAIIYEGKHVSPASYWEKTLVVNSLSKEFAATGWRLGYAVCAEKELIEKMAIVQSQTISCPTSFVQYAALFAWESGVREWVKLMLEELRRRRDVLYDEIKEFSRCERPSGTFYLFPNFGLDDVKLSEELLERRVATIPGKLFGEGGRGCLRLSYGCCSAEQLVEAARVIQEVVEGWSS